MKIRPKTSSGVLTDLEILVNSGQYTLDFKKMLILETGDMMLKRVQDYSKVKNSNVELT